MHKVLFHLYEKCKNRQNDAAVLRDAYGNDKDKMIKQGVYHHESQGSGYLQAKGACSDYKR